MKTTFLLLFIFCMYAVASELEWRDARNRYLHCISTASQFIHTDLDITDMTMLCEARTGYTETDY